MPTIGVIDDQESVRQMAKDRIEYALERIRPTETWDVIAAEPLPSLSDYAGWLSENEVSVLVLDQQLNQETDTEYSGNDIVRVFRPVLFELPVYYLTAHVEDGAVQADAARVQGILNQQEFFMNPDLYVTEFIAEGTRYQERVARKLARLSEVAEAVAGGKATEDDKAEAAAIRQSLELPFSPLVAEADQRADVLAKIETSVEGLEALTKRLAEAIERHQIEGK